MPSLSTSSALSWIEPSSVTTTMTTKARGFPVISNHQHNKVSTNTTTTTNATTTTFEIVVTILHDRRQSKKRLWTETADWLLSTELQDVPVTLCSPDRLVDPEQVVQFGRRTQHFDPTHVFGSLLQHSAQRNRSVTLLPILNGQLASEVPGYLTYILQQWESLPDVVIFLHSIPHVHNPHFLSHIRHVMDHWTPAQIGFLNINDHIMICRESRGPGGSWWKYWEVLGFDVQQHVPRRVKLPCCAQFMVTRERLQLRTKWFYQQALKLAYETQDAVFFEHYFHMIWGEAPILSEDRELRTYARSNWTKPVHDAVLHNPYPNVPCAESMKVWCEKAQADPKAYYPKRSEFREACPPGNEYWYSDNKKGE